MKKHISFVSVILSALLLSSCSQTQPDVPDALINEIVNDPALTAQNTAAAAPSSASADKGEQTVSSADTSVDLDLTAMNSNMIYSVIYDMMINPDNYYGKSMLVDGYFDTLFEERLDTRYFFVVVPDAAACCVQGLEFKLGDDKAYPSDYPEPSTDIRIRGVLDCYEEEGQTYAYIRADEMLLT